MKDSHASRMFFCVALVLLAPLALAACGGGAETTIQATPITASAPTSEAPRPLSAAEIGQWKTDAVAFADGFYGQYGDVTATFPELAADATFYDPCDGDFLTQGKEPIVSMLQGLFAGTPGFGAEREGMYLSAGGTACAVAEPDLWPPWLPEADHPPARLMQVFRFEDALVASWDLLFAAATLEMVQTAAFAPGKGGSERLQQIVDRYLAAWSSGDKDRIAALYRTDATFSDTVLGLRAEGADAIAELSNERFGEEGPVTFKVIDLWVQTNGPAPPTKKRPKDGVIIVVGIHYRSMLVVDGEPSTVEGLTTFELGQRAGDAFHHDPKGLIAREEVFYDADSLLASGLVR